MMIVFAFALLVLGFGILAYVYEIYERETSVTIGNRSYYLCNHVGFWKWMLGKDED